MQVKLRGKTESKDSSQSPLFFTIFPLDKRVLPIKKSSISKLYFHDVLTEKHLKINGLLLQCNMAPLSKLWENELLMI